MLCNQVNQSEICLNPLDEEEENGQSDSSDDYNPICFPRTFVEIDCHAKETAISFLQDSLFPEVCPTIYFGLESEKVYFYEKYNNKVIWRLSTITPNLLKGMAIRSGLKLLKDTSAKNQWIATWCKHLKPEEFSGLKEYQKVNHFPGCFHLGRKDRLSINLKKFSGSEAFYPKTFILPEDIDKLKKSKLIGRKTMIMKPPAASRGIGVTLITKWAQIPTNAKLKRKVNRSVVVVQEYIENPCLLLNRFKFDLRVYVLVTSFKPLRMYIYQNGLVRFASEEYSSDIDSINNLFVHVTNYTINKKNENYNIQDNLDCKSGNKWPLQILWDHLRENYPHVNVDELWSKIIDIAIKTIVCVRPNVINIVDRFQKYRYNCFELYGFDIMLDSNFKPWLLEVNISPSLKTESFIDTIVKEPLIKDVLNTVGCRLSLCKLRAENTKQKCYHRRFPFFITDEKDNEKHMRFDCYKDYDIIEDLTPNDLRLLVETEDELSRCGDLKRIFPSVNSEQYLAHFDSNDYYDFLLNAWEKRYQFCREDGIEKIRQLCLNGYHLMSEQSVSTPESEEK